MSDLEIILKAKLTATGSYDYIKNLRSCKNVGKDGERRDKIRVGFRRWQERDCVEIREVQRKQRLAQRRVGLQEGKDQDDRGSS